MKDYDQILLRKNHRSQMPKSILYLDTETRTRRIGPEEHHRFDFGWTCLKRYAPDGIPQSEDWKFHNDAFSLCSYTEKLAIENRRLYLLAHNIFFDQQVSDFFFWFTKWGYLLNFYYDQGLTYILTIVKDKTTITCLSTTNWFDTNLKGLGDLISLPKKEVDFKKSSRKKLIDYCHRDVEIIIKAMEFYLSFIHDHDLGQFSHTKASQAYHAYRHRFMSHKIYCHQDDEVRRLERKAYYGGRVECFELGEITKGPFLYFDVNSMYSFVMSENIVPTKLVEYHTTYDLDKLREVLNIYCAVAEVELVTPEPMYAVRYKNKIIFPTGHFVTYLCSEGLKRAIDKGHIQKIKQLALYRGDIIFRDYIDFLYPLKERYHTEKNNVMRELTKKMLNSLYGKFAQRRPIVETVEEVTCDGYYRMDCFNLVTGERGMEYKMFNRIVQTYGYEETPATFTAISAHITEAARMLLWDIIDSVGYKNVIYCDTDSIIIRQKDRGKLKYPIDEKAMGALKLESVINRLSIYGPKSYIMDDDRKFKGVPKTAEEIEPLKFSYQTFLRQASHMEKQVDRWYILRDTVKKVKTSYDKGVILKSGKIRPFEARLSPDGVIFE